MGDAKEGDESEEDEEEEKEVEEGGWGDTSTADFSFELPEVYDNPLAAKASEGRRHHKTKG